MPPPQTEAVPTKGGKGTSKGGKTVAGGKGARAGAAGGGVVEDEREDVPAPVPPLEVTNPRHVYDYHRSTWYLVQFPHNSWSSSLKHCGLNKERCEGSGVRFSKTGVGIDW